MSESFFRRWSRRKAETAQGPEGQDGLESAGRAAVPDVRTPDSLEPAGAHAAICNGSTNGRTPLPSMKDVASLAPDSDYSLFLASGVDKTVRRAAMKKLFSDPHFNVMDGLDIYIDDYTKPSPLPPGMLEALQHAKSTLEPKPLYKTDEDDDDEQGLDEQADDDASGNAEEGGADDEAAHEAQEPAQAEAENDTSEAVAEAQAGQLPPSTLPLQSSPSSQSTQAAPQDTPTHSKEFPLS